MTNLISIHKQPESKNICKKIGSMLSQNTINDYKKFIRKPKEVTYFEFFTDFNKTFTKKSKMPN